MGKLFSSLKAKIIAGAIIGIGAIAGITVMTGGRIGNTKIPIVGDVMSNIYKKELVDATEALYTKNIIAEYEPPILSKYINMSEKVVHDGDKLKQISVHASVDNIPIIDDETNKIQNLSFKLDYIQDASKIIYLKLTLKAPEIDKALEEEKIPDSLKTYILDLLSGKKWISFSPDDIKDLASLSGEVTDDKEIDQLFNMADKQLSKDDWNKLMYSLKDSFDVHKDMLGNYSLILNKEGIKKDIEKLKEDRDLLEKIGYTKEELDDIAKSVDKASDAWFTKPIAVFGIKSGRLYYVKIYLPIDFFDVSQDDLKDAISKIDEDLKEESISQEEKKILKEVKSYLEQTLKDGRFDFGKIVYTKVDNSIKPDKLPSGSDVVSLSELFSQIMLMMMGGSMYDVNNNSVYPSTPYPSIYNQDYYPYKY